MINIVSYKDNDSVLNIVLCYIKRQMSMLNNIVGYWAYIQGTYIQGGAYIRGAYIWNQVSIIFRGLQYTVEKSLYFLVIDTHFWVHIEQLIRWVLMSIQW